MTGTLMTGDARMQAAELRHLASQRELAARKIQYSQTSVLKYLNWEGGKRLPFRDADHYGSGFQVWYILDPSRMPDLRGTHPSMRRVWMLTLRPLTADEAEAFLTAPEPG
jgi:hypothetical protein